MSWSNGVGSGFYEPVIVAVARHNNWRVRHVLWRTMWRKTAFTCLRHRAKPITGFTGGKRSKPASR